MLISVRRTDRVGSGVIRRAAAAVEEVLGWWPLQGLTHLKPMHYPDPPADLDGQMRDIAN